ncbi:MAG TPA: MBL fold metallo-hydrolase [Planctomycetota bacterium]|jgi:metallo-beta-lactamase family protein|nr:MBL fold metallo-hydrolase [Planctomycetota bacterium]OQC20397.1 MAG: Ribonuclease [Planctomycetes bacterium ADurb.Bin069]NMD34432.1 MBL fold metallo-hydrolase [Planctomycetota bacterium]HNR98617.1 MBL fold metallo-hydrolase [Planctomycetota bacterium]HNU24997.1 MBL fold metallo-hydrolase [Planctomycetota bacterium]
MKLTFYGATRAVTGSAHLLEVNGRRLLLDCGLHQGKRKEAFERNRNLLMPADTLDAVLLSHAHIDHSGNLPTLVKRGFRGTIYATSATCDLCSIMLPDSGHLQEQDVQFVNKKRARLGKNPFEPLYTVEEAEAVMPYFQAVSFEEPFRIDGQTEVIYHGAGHILGAAITEIRAGGGGGARRIIYSGDLGRPSQPILRDPWPLEPNDVLIMETTYGGRRHEGAQRIEEKLLPILRKAVPQRGKIVIPSFSVGRTQHLVHILHKFWKNGDLPPMPIYVDSPLSVNATEVFRRHPECYDEETLALLARREDPFGFARLVYVRDVQESKALNDRPGPMVIISASGMCEGGRVLHHLAHTVGDARNTVLIIGYQAENTLGRQLVEKRPEVKIFGERYTVRAEVETINAFSAHADRQELLDWMAGALGRLGLVFLVHGEETQSVAFLNELTARGVKNVIIPHAGQTWDL